MTVNAIWGAFLMTQLVKNMPAMWKTWVRSLGWEDSPGEGKGYPLRYSGLENSMDYSRTQLSDFHFQCIFLNWVIHLLKSINTYANNM